MFVCMQAFYFKTNTVRIKTQKVRSKTKTEMTTVGKIS